MLAKMVTMVIIKTLKHEKLVKVSIELKKNLKTTIAKYH